MIDLFDIILIAPFSKRYGWAGYLAAALVVAAIFYGLVGLNGCSGKATYLEVKQVLKDVDAGLERYRQDNGRFPDDVQQLIDDDYVKVDRSVLRHWRLEFRGSSPVQAVIATKKTAGGEDKISSVEYNFEEKQFYIDNN